MVEDTKMIETENSEISTKAETKKDSEKVTIPPLEAAAQRLERLLGGGSSDTDKSLDFYTNPVKVVRRWLGTSSGVAKNATADDIKAAAIRLLDPSGPCSVGRSFLVTSSDIPEAMETDKEKAPVRHLSRASDREVESWLISLQVRLLWKEGKFMEAFDLCTRGIASAMNHIDEASLRVTSASAGSASSLFPLLSRLYRLRSLVTESLPSFSVTLRLREDMAKAHNMASLRRDVDTQATVLNCMLRDLLLQSQGKS